MPQKNLIKSKWFHKEPSTSEEPLFHNSLFVAKEGSSDYKKVRKRCSLTEWFFYASIEEPFKHLYF